MSDDTTTATETTTAPAPDNVVPFTTAAGDQPATAPSQPAASTGVSATPAAEQPAEPQINSLESAIEHTLKDVDLNEVSHHDIVHDLFLTCQQQAFKLLLAAKLFEHTIVRDAQGVRGQVLGLLRHADDAVLTEVHAILAAKVKVPEPAPAPAAE